MAHFVASCGSASAEIFNLPNSQLKVVLLSYFYYWSESCLQYLASTLAPLYLIVNLGQHPKEQEQLQI